jgi:cellulose synthase/poly-beta-1,6-N-acetylglucosamine synthase-like glycosyltransferase
MIYLFWIAAGLLVHTYFLYPVSLPILRLFSRFPGKQGNPNKYKVSLIIAAHNEEKVIEEKIKNCFDLEFPRKNLEILIGSDASTDATNAIVAKYAPAVKLYEFNNRGGKASVLNQLVPKAHGDILVFCDANTMLLRNALQKLLSHFEDPAIGCVCGRLILHDAGNSALGIGESMYWNLESEIKKLEGRLGIVIGANGGIYALRKELFSRIPIEKKAMDDFYVTTRVLKAGKAAIYEPQAIGSEETSLDAYGEFHRKIRISQANFNLLTSYLPLLNPFRGLVAYGFFSHKLLRWIAPLLMIAMLASNAFLLARGPVYYAAFGVQAALYFLAGLGYARNGKTRRSKLLLVPFYFVSMNLALLFGLYRALFKKEGGMWKRIERSNVRVDHMDHMEHNGLEKRKPSSTSIAAMGSTGVTAPQAAVVPMPARAVNELSP